MKKTAINSAATKPSWMGDYSIGQVTSSLQTSSGQRSSINLTLTAMFEGRSKQTLRGGGDVKSNKEKHKKKIPGDHNIEGYDSAKKFYQQHAGKKLKRKNKSPRSLRPNEQSAGVFDRMQKNQTDPARQSKGSPSHSFSKTKPSDHLVATSKSTPQVGKPGQKKHVFFGDNGSQLSKTKRNDYFISTGNHNFGKQLTPGSHKTTLEVDKINCKTDQSKHIFFGDDGGNLFPRSKGQGHGRKERFSSKKEPSNQTNQSKNKNNYKTKKKQNREKDSDETKFSTEKDGNSLKIKQEQASAKMGTSAVIMEQKRNNFGKRAQMRKRKRLSETTSNNGVLHVLKKTENECSEKAAKKTKRRKRNKFANAEQNKNTVESKTFIKGAEVVNKQILDHDSKIEGKETKKKSKRKWKIKSGHTSKDDENSKINEKKNDRQVDAKNGTQKAKLGIKDEGKRASPMKKRRRRKKNPKQLGDPVASQKSMALSPAGVADDTVSHVAAKTIKQTKRGRKRMASAKSNQGAVLECRAHKKTKLDDCISPKPRADSDYDENDDIRYTKLVKEEDVNDFEKLPEKRRRFDVLREHSKNKTIDTNSEDDCSDEQQLTGQKRPDVNSDIVSDQSSQSSSSDEEMEEVDDDVGGETYFKMLKDETDDESVDDFEDNDNEIEDVLNQYALEVVEETKTKGRSDSNDVFDSDEDDEMPKSSKHIHDREVLKRTIFVGNLPTTTTKSDLKELFKKYGHIESSRFRSGARAEEKISQKVAMITKQLHPERSSYNAYIVFKTPESAQCAVERNGELHNNHHIRVDLVTNSKKHDTKHSVFVGNLPFDLETEPLTTHFMQCGAVEAVRLIRDRATGLGKGFGYVRFQDSSCVQLALKLDGSSLAGRNIRVSRAMKREALQKQQQQKMMSRQRRGGKKLDKMSKEKQNSKGDKNEGEEKRRRLDPKILQKRQKRLRYKRKLKAKGDAGKIGKKSKGTTKPKGKKSQK